MAPLLAGAVDPQAQPPSSAPAQAPVFRAEANYVEVEAFVTDEAGKAVSGLSRDDFQVFEEGAREEIAVFAEVRIPIDRTEATPSERARSTQDVATNEEGIRGRVFAIVLDELHTDASRSGEVRKLAREFVELHMARHDVAAVVSTGGRADGTFGFTADRRLLLEAVERFAGRKARSATLERLDTIERQRDLLRAEPDTRNAPPPPEQRLAPRPGLERDPSDLLRVHDARAAMETLERTARSFGGLDGRRKAIVWFGEGIDYDTLDVMGKTQRDAPAILQSMRQAIASATRHGVAVYAVDPRGGLSPGGPDDIQMTAPARGAAFGIDSQSLAREARLSQDSLRTLAEQTGGIAFVDTNDFAGAFERIVHASSLYYLFGYYPSDSRRDGAYRRLDVRVARRGLHVLAREGYVRPGPETEKAAAPRIATADGTSPELRALLDSPWPQPGLALAVTAAAFKGTGRDAPVAVTIQLPRPGEPLLPEREPGAHETEVSFVVIDQDGNVRAGERILARPRVSAPAPEPGPRSGLRFVRSLRLPAGRYQLRVAAREGDGGHLGSVSYDFEVPDYGEQKLALSSVLIASRQSALALTPAIDEEMKARLKAPPTATRRFAPGDVVTAYAEVYDALEPAHEVGMTTRVATLDGHEVFRDTRLRAAGELASAVAGFRHEVEIPLAAMRPGRYVLQIAATSTLGEPTASRDVPFEIVPSLEPGTGDAPPSPPASPARHAEGVPPSSRIDRLEAWLAAVERHEPGTSDPPALLVRSWTPAELLDLAADIAMVTALIRDPRHLVMWLADPERPGRPQQAPYSPADELRIRALAKEAAEGCDRPPLAQGASSRTAEARAACARNRLLKRGALLHTDALVRGGEEQAARHGGDVAQRFRIRFDDGQQRGAEEASGQLEFAQALLDNVTPAPERDETVRLWYTAVSAYGQYYQRHTREEDRGVQLFPEDADLLLFAGTFHEALASPRMQSLARSIRMPEGASHGIADARSELREAEKLLRRAVASRPSFDEARIRLGRVLYRLGRTEQAARELARARSGLSSGGGKRDADGGLLLYYAELFLGAASEALGSFDSAKASYTRAAALYPQAPSPRLAQSQLAIRGQDRTNALAAVQVALRPFAGVEDATDPWWRYHVIQGRSFDAWFEKLYRSATAEQ